MGVYWARFERPSTVGVRGRRVRRPDLSDMARWVVRYSVRQVVVWGERV